jgi:uncharacterized C2H2 Zn-finger protein
MEQQPGGTGGGLICEKCGASFETQEELDRHVQETHQDERDAEGVVRQG